jgi:hypothetical protein
MALWRGRLRLPDERQGARSFRERVQRSPEDVLRRSPQAHEDREADDLFISGMVHWLMADHIAFVLSGFTSCGRAKNGNKKSLTKRGHGEYIHTAHVVCEIRRRGEEVVNKTFLVGILGALLSVPPFSFEEVSGQGKGGGALSVHTFLSGGGAVRVSEDENLSELKVNVRGARFPLPLDRPEDGKTCGAASQEPLLQYGCVLGETLCWVACRPGERDYCVLPSDRCVISTEIPCRGVSYNVRECTVPCSDGTNKICRATVRECIF